MEGLSYNMVDGKPELTEEYQNLDALRSLGAWDGFDGWGYIEQRSAWHYMWDEEACTNMGNTSITALPQEIYWSTPLYEELGSELAAKRKEVFAQVLGGVYTVDEGWDLWMSEFDRIGGNDMVDDAPSTLAQRAVTRGLSQSVGWGLAFRPVLSPLLQAKRTRGAHKEDLRPFASEPDSNLRISEESDMNRIPGGVYPVMITPFTDENTIDWATVDGIVEFYTRMGCQGIFAVRASSEIPCLSEDERVELARRVARTARGRMCVVASGHTGRHRGSDSRAYARVSDRRGRGGDDLQPPGREG